MADDSVIPVRARAYGLCPDCSVCGEELAGLKPAICGIPGQWIHVPAFGHCVFVLHPTVPLELISLPNGQLALTFPDVVGGPTTHVHEECLRAVAGDELYDIESDEDEDLLEEDEPVTF